MPELPLPPGSTLGILGGGQLGRMLALAAARLGFDVAVLERDADSPAGRVAAHTIVGAYDDPAALEALAAVAQVVTFEFENVPAASVLKLQSLGVEVAPGPEALAVAQDRIAEKQFLNASGAPTVAFASADTPEEAVAGVIAMGAPVLMKTRRDGYDGKGQRWVEHAPDAATIFAELGGVPVILEAPADFVRELSIIAARGRDGATAIYPLSENHHEGGILRRSLAPAHVSPDLAFQAEKIAARVLKGLNYVGVVGIELFELKDGTLLVNEIAPRVHNTGHWTEDGCAVDQFEQHIRAVAGWPLGPTTPHARVEMLNLLGDEADAWSKLAQEPESRLHLYGKRDAKPGRKMGHVNKLKAL
ncbi:MAG: 5-(carboxyamino)imidazole ribonucleotide synthase [Alphaproteobacteria bacterium]|nr:5-(carboxyamino)imidazole ribonucleotide synthase [Alphaproteobacteria bacterium]MBU1514177.1 5-(carboxyamino)imidazole ribonucleotide synthase [Alphaproteobacteria bacterium]MBU2096174.1 5-(carboxyamino)imidazole ribonucleotide synthase [Alphaproteobacteria bacterium]MBU2151128.1 5-(carboxyamino)imidazole ribonucleotide synthase [Alphaproteobacteria bacterium]MBU2307213.1 5-(carboxyamino)imidazole ribonucleotide synthase [Alphaproteobacteria bacterium]